MKILHYVLIGLFAFIIGGCAVKVDLQEYKDVSSVNFVNEKTSQFEYKTPKLNPKLSLSENSNYSKYAYNSLMSLLSSSNIFEFNEYEKNAYSLEVKCDFYDFEKTYNPSKFIRTGKDLKTGQEKGYYTKPFWEITTSVKVTTILKNNANGSSKFYSNSGRNYYTVEASSWSSISASETSYNQAIDQAMSKTLMQIGNDILPRAIVISSKVNIDDADDYIFLINMGSNHGIKAQQKATVFASNIEKDQTKSKTINSDEFIGSARVSNQISRDNAWIVMDDEDNNKKVKVGDEVKIIFGY